MANLRTLRIIFLYVTHAPNLPLSYPLLILNTPDIFFLSDHAAYSW